MATTAPHPYDLIGTDLRAFYQAEGQELWRNRSRLMGLLLDHQPELRREIRAVVSAVEQGVARSLGETERSLAALAIDRQASLMEAEVGLRPDIAQNVTRTIAHALDLGPLPSVYAGAIVPPPQTWSQRFAPPPHVAPQPVTQPGFDPYSSMQRSIPIQPPGPGRRFPWPIAILGTAIALAAAIVVVPRLAVAPAGTTTASTRGYADELADFGVPAQATLRDAMGGATPLEIGVGRRVTTDELNGMIAQDPNLLLLDVLVSPHDQTVANAHYVPVAGLAGNLQDGNQTSLSDILSNLTGNDAARGIVVFCAGAACWESYNAALRAGALGYTNVYWYRGGLAAWQEARLPMNALPAAAQGAR